MYNLFYHVKLRSPELSDDIKNMRQGDINLKIREKLKGKSQLLNFLKFLKSLFVNKIHCLFHRLLHNHCFRGAFPLPFVWSRGADC